MKITKNLFCLLILLFFASNVFVAKKSDKKNNAGDSPKINSVQKKLTVAPPVFNNATSSDEWLSEFVRGQLTTDFQQYSGYTIIDRTMASLILSEQEKAEQNDYLSASSGESEIIYANLVDTDYVVAVEITRTSSTYALRASVQDVKAAVTVDNAAYSETEIVLDSFSNGDVIHKVSASLMKGLGLVVPDELFTKASDSDTKANLNIAKDMAAEKKRKYTGGNFILQKGNRKCLCNQREYAEA